MQREFFSRSSLVRCLVLSSASMLLFCIGFFLPPLGLAALVFTPTPMALLGAREGKAWMTLGILGVTLTLGLVLGMGYAVSFLLGYGLLCFGLTLPLGRVDKGNESLLFCVITSIVSKVFFVAVSVAVIGINPFEIDPGTLHNMLNSVYSGMSGKGGQEAALLRESLIQAVALIPYMFPFFIIVYSMFDSFLNYRLCEILQRKREVTFPPLPPFGEWRFPKSLLFAIIFAFALPFLVKSDNRLWTMLEYNLKFLVNVFFFLQGVSLVWWWLSKYAARHFFPLPLRIMMIGFLSMPLLNTWVVALGLGDICINFRTKKIKRA